MGAVSDGRILQVTPKGYNPIRPITCAADFLGVKACPHPVGLGVQAMSWMVARTQPRREKIAKEFVELQGRIAYYPLMKDSFSGTIAPLFPNYLFVFDADGLWRFINRTYGIVCLIMRSGKPDLMSDETMQVLRSNERDGLVEIHKFRHGDKVDIVGSALDGWAAIYDGMSPSGRVRVLLEMLGQQVPVQLDKHHIRAHAT
jgi:transcription antitermination factor NusG